MELNVQDDKKLVEVWLTNQERDNLALRERLRPLCKRYKNEGYLVAVFYSGKENLYDQTLELLRYNRRRAAQREPER